MSTEDAISCAGMRELVDAGRARALLPGRFPSPVVLHGPLVAPTRGRSG